MTFFRCHSFLNSQSIAKNAIAIISGGMAADPLTLPRVENLGRFIVSGIVCLFPSIHTHTHSVCASSVLPAAADVFSLTFQLRPDTFVRMEGDFVNFGDLLFEKGSYLSTPASEGFVLRNYGLINIAANGWLVDFGSVHGTTNSPPALFGSSAVR